MAQVAKGNGSEMLLLQGLPVDAATLFPEPDGFLGNRAKAKRAKLLAGIREVLGKALAPGETVRYAVRGFRYHVAEFYFAGWAAYYHNQTVLVATDRRLLVVHVGSRGAPADIKFQVRPEVVRKISSGVFAGLSLSLADGTTLKFSGVKGADRKRMGALLAARADPKAPKSATPSIEHLCPACLRLVPGPVGATLQCPEPSCRIPYRDPARAARLSAFVPGLGDLYLRHHWFGAFEFMGSMALLGVGAGFVIAAVAERDAGLAGASAIVAVAVIVFPRVIDYFLTRHMGRKGLVPLALAPAPGAQARNLPSFPRWAPLLFLLGLAVAGGLGFAFAQVGHEQAGVNAVIALAGKGDFEGAIGRYHDNSGSFDEADRVRLAIALREAGDLEGAEGISADFQGTKIEAAVADRWNAMRKADQAALEAFGQGVQEYVKGNQAAGWKKIDAALPKFANVKRPHLPHTRAEVLSHFAAAVLAPPLGEDDVAAAASFAEQARGAPASELTALRASIQSVRGDEQGARATLAKLGPEPLPLSFHLLVLEARARIAKGDAERREVATAAKAIAEDGLDDDDLERVSALTGE